MTNRFSAIWVVYSITEGKPAAIVSSHLEAYFNREDARAAARWYKGCFPDIKLKILKYETQHG